MEQVTDLIYCGCDADVDEFLELHPDGYIVHAAKDPWHRQALGYTGRGAPKDHPEYLTALRGNELILNLVDSPDPKWIPAECFIKADYYINQWHDEGHPILIHCNQGHSRGPGVLFYHIIQHDIRALGTDNFEDAVESFKENFYPDFSPAGGVYGFLEETFNGKI